MNKLLVGNKSDLEAKRAVTTEEAKVRNAVCCVSGTFLQMSCKNLAEILLAFCVCPRKIVCNRGRAKIRDGAKAPCWNTHGEFRGTVATSSLVRTGVEADEAKHSFFRFFVSVLYLFLSPAHPTPAIKYNSLLFPNVSLAAYATRFYYPPAAAAPTGVCGHPGDRVPRDLRQERIERREGLHDDGQPDQEPHEEPAHGGAPRGHEAHGLHTSLGGRLRRRMLLILFFWLGFDPRYDIVSSSRRASFFLCFFLR